LQVLQLILELANGDLRKAITFLQTAQRLHGATNPPTPVSTLSSKRICWWLTTSGAIVDQPVHEISGVVPDDTVNGLLAVVGIDRDGVNTTLTKGGFEAVRSAVKSIGREGWSAGQILEQVSD
jgi:replication factor C subunit 2/4